jgi:hypothetical protein
VATTAPRRRWFRFSLPTLFVLVTAAAVLAALARVYPEILILLYSAGGVASSLAVVRLLIIGQDRAAKLVARVHGRGELNYYRLKPVGWRKIVATD